MTMHTCVHNMRIPISLVREERFSYIVISRTRMIMITV
jgi:hypothetical protein